MKRFWKDAAVEQEGNGWTIRLDGRPVRTPAGLRLFLPTEALAEAIADEWRSVGEKIDPQTMPLTGLANAAIDRVASDHRAFADTIAKYAQADLACYRAERPRELVAEQEQEWNELLAWARRRYDIDFITTSQLMHVEQPGATVERLSHAVSSLDPFRLAGLSSLVAIGGSLLAALGVAERAIRPDDAWRAVSLEERWQLERWGSDVDAQVSLESRARDFFAAARFLDLID